MNESDFKKLQLNMVNYINSIKVSDETKYKINYKIAHTNRVIGVGEELAKELHLDITLAKTICLLHDIGRFPQIEKYNTFRDSDSVDHAMLGVQVLNELKFLDSFKEKDLIITAIKYHNKISYDVPEFDEPTNTYVKLIRDADKIDIYKGNYDFNMFTNIKLPFSKKCFTDFMDGKMSDRKYVISDIDNLILTLAWIYDINFDYTFTILKNQGYLKKTLELLPKDSDLDKIKQVVLSKLNSY